MKSYFCHVWFYLSILLHSCFLCLDIYVRVQFFFSNKDQILTTSRKINGNIFRSVNLTWSFPDSWYFPVLIFQGSGHPLQLRVVTEAAKPQNIYEPAQDFSLGIHTDEGT